MKRQIVTTICDMPHTQPTPEAVHTVAFVLSGRATRAARNIDLCNDCAKKFIEPLMRNARIVKR